MSGDLRGNDIEVDYTWDLIGAEDRFDNSHNVVYASEVDETAVLDGFTIRGGYNDNLFGAFGAGMYNGYANPKIRNCTFEDNFAGSAMSMGDGAGMSNYYSNPTLTNCTFRRNCMGYEGEPSILFPGAVGGGLSNFHSDPELKDCVFDRNVSLDVGGAMFNYDSDPILINCTFNANAAGAWGGALNNSESSAVMTNCQVTLNIAGSGGAVNCESSDMTITNCTFADNIALFRGNGFWCDSYAGSPVSSLDFTNCILWDGDDQILNDDRSDIIINYSDVQGGWSGGGANNINADPLFAERGYWAHIDDPTVILAPEDPNAVQYGGDYHLKSESGRWDPVGGDWVHDDVTSPCINAGDPDSAVGDEPEPNGGIINMGAYGGTTESSKSPAD